MEQGSLKDAWAFHHALGKLRKRLRKQNKAAQALEIHALIMNVETMCRFSQVDLSLMMTLPHLQNTLSHIALDPAQVHLLEEKWKRFQVFLMHQRWQQHTVKP